MENKVYNINFGHKIYSKFILYTICFTTSIHLKSGVNKGMRGSVDYTMNLTKN